MNDILAFLIVNATMTNPVLTSTLDFLIGRIRIECVLQAMTIVMPNYLFLTIIRTLLLVLLKIKSYRFNERPQMINVMLPLMHNSQELVARLFQGHVRPLQTGR